MAETTADVEVDERTGLNGPSEGVAWIHLSQDRTSCSSV
jgi:hypothetical protein